MAVPREETYTIEDILQPTSLQTDDLFSEEDNSMAGSNSLLLGSISRTSTSSGRVATVKAGEDIRPAINSLKSAGGGTLILLAGTHRPTYDIVGDSKINIVGEGIDQTIIDFQGGNYQIKYQGVANNRLSRFTIENLTLQNSTNVNGTLLIEFCDYWSVNYVESKSGSGYGIQITSSSFWNVENSFFDSNSLDGLRTNGGLFYSDATEFFQIKNTVASNNTQNGFNLNSESPYNANYGGGVIIGCTSFLNDLVGFLCGNTAYQSLCFCMSILNDVGYRFSSENTIQTGCRSIQNTTGFDISGNYISSIGSSSVSDSTPMSVTGLENIITGNDHNIVTTPDLGNYVLNTKPSIAGAIPGSTVIGGSPYGFSRSSKLLTALNVSGGTISLGSVVVVSPSVGYDEVTTTTTQGDDYVLGVAVSSANDNRTISILVEGETAVLKVNGTSAIAVGDFLCTYTVAGIAAKAGAGDMAFAIALEAYSTADSNGVINAFLITPRKI